MVRTSLVVFLLLNCHRIFAQNLVTARVIDASTQKGVPAARVVNLENGQNTFTNSLGFFQCEVESNDNIVVQKQGYQIGTLKAPGGGFQVQLLKDSASNIIRDIEHRLLSKEIRQHSAFVINEFFPEPYPWAASAMELKSVKRNKVKLVKNEYMDCKYDLNGNMISLKSRYNSPIEFIHRRNHGFEYSFYDANGRLSMRISLVDKNQPIQKRIFEYRGDTAIVSWVNDDVQMGMGIVYKNIFVDLDVKTQRLVHYVYFLIEGVNGYKIQERNSADGGKTWQTMLTYFFNTNDQLINLRNDSFSVNYEYSSTGCRTTESIYRITPKETSVKSYETLMARRIYIRDEKDLVLKCIELRGPFDRKGDSKFNVEINYSYDFFE